METVPAVTFAMGVTLGVLLHLVSWWLHQRWVRLLAFLGGLLVLAWLGLLVWLSMEQILPDFGDFVIFLVMVQFAGAAVVIGGILAVTFRRQIPWYHSMLAGWVHVALIFAAFEAMSHGVYPPLSPLGDYLDSGLLVPSVMATFVILLLLRPRLNRDQGWQAPISGFND